MPHAAAFRIANRCCRRWRLADMIAGLSGAMATVTALFARASGARRAGDRSFAAGTAGFHTGPGGGDLPAHRRKYGSVPATASAFRRRATSIAAPMDNYAALSGSTAATARRIFEIIGRPDMMTDPRFATNDARVKNRALIDEIIGAWFAQRHRAEAIAQMQAAGVTAGPVYDVADGLADPHFQARGVFVDVEDPELGSHSNAQYRAAAFRRRPECGADRRRRSVSIRTKSWPRPALTRRKSPRCAPKEPAHEHGSHRRTATRAAVFASVSIDLFERFMPDPFILAIGLAAFRRARGRGGRARAVRSALSSPPGIRGSSAFSALPSRWC